MERIQSSIPGSAENSPAVSRVNLASPSAKPQEKPTVDEKPCLEEKQREKAPEEEKPRTASPPSRQETVDEAAMLAISGHHG